MRCADAMLESVKPKLTWLGMKGELGMPKFLPELPKPHRDRLEALVEREETRFRRRVERAAKSKPAKDAKRSG
jgi:hypothetical protein